MLECNCKSRGQDHRPGALGRTGARTSDQPFLIFVSFSSRKKKKQRAKARLSFLYFKGVPHCFSLCVFLLDQKNQKSSISDRLRTAFSPPRPGGYLSGCFSGFIILVHFNLNFIPVKEASNSQAKKPKPFTSFL